MFTINARTLDGRWKPVLGALQGRSCKHHYHEWGSEHQAATAAVVGHPEKALTDLQVLNDETGETTLVSDLLTQEIADFLRGHSCRKDEK